MLFNKIRQFSRLEKLRKFSSFPLLKENKIQVLDSNINYVETLGCAENAHPIFLLPGGGLGSIETDFEPILHELNRQKYKWISWDAPGSGKSQHSSRPFPQEGHECVFAIDAEYAAELMKKLGYENYTVVAWSGSAITAIKMASQHPKKVSGLITLGGFGYFGPQTLPRLQAFKKVGINGIPKSRRAKLVSYSGEKEFSELWSATADELLRMCESEIYRTNGTFQNIIANVECPVLVMHGEKDTLIDVSYGHHLNSTFRNSRLHLFENGSHNLHLKNTKEFVSCIQNFVDEVVYNQTHSSAKESLEDQRHNGQGPLDIRQALIGTMYH